jgi:Transposase
MCQIIRTEDCHIIWKATGITDQAYYRWRKEYGGLQVDHARRLKELEQENAKLKRLVADLSLDKLVLKDIASEDFYARSNGAVRLPMQASMV